MDLAWIHGAIRNPVVAEVSYESDMETVYMICAPSLSARYNY